MKKITFFLVLFLIITQTVTAREIKGYFISFQKDTTFTTFDIPVVAPNNPDIKQLHFGLKYWDSNGIERALKPYDAIEVTFVYNEETFTLVSQQDYLNLAGRLKKPEQNYIFLKLEVDGAMQLFSYHYTQHVTMDFSFESQTMVYKRSNDLMFVPKHMRYKSSLVKYFKDCPKLAKKIKVGLYEKGDDLEIVKEYNKTCAERA